MPVDHALDEPMRGQDLESLGAPPELGSRSGIAAADEVHPEGVPHRRGKPMGRDRKPGALRRFVHAVQRPTDPRGDDGVLDEGVRADDMHRLRALLRPKPLQRHPDELKGGGRVLAAAVPHHPGNRVGEIELRDLVDELLNGRLEVVFQEGNGVQSSSGRAVNQYRVHLPLSVLRARGRARGVA